MSADNGIYILPLEDGFYVAHCQAIDNLTFDRDHGYDPETVVCYFGGTECFPTKQKAVEYAVQMSNEYEILEYGISTLEAQPHTMDEYVAMALKQEQKNNPEWKVVTILPNGCYLYRKENEVGGHVYQSDEIGGGVFVWDTALVDETTLLAAIYDQHKVRYWETVRKDQT